MSSAMRWTLCALAVVLVVGMLICARGEKHHRGDDVGSLGIAGTLAGA